MPTRITQARRPRAVGLLEDVLRDVQFAIRSLRKSPAFAATAILALTIGIGVNTAMFSVIRGVLLRPLNYHDPDRLVYLFRGDPGATRDRWISIERFEEMRSEAQSFAGLGAFLSGPEDVTLSGVGEPEALKGARVSANFLGLLGLRPALGRTFLPEEEAVGGPPVAMISTSLWKRRFGADRSLAGKTATLNSVSHTIIGVTPPGLQFPFRDVDVWVTQPSQSAKLEPRFRACCAPLLAFGRLKPGITPEQARAELRVLNQRDASNPKRRVGGGPLRLVNMKDHVTANIDTMLWVLVGAVGFVLLIACANVAGLLMARSPSRARELALKSALGAARGRLVRQLLTESVLLAVAAGVLGLLLARLTIGVVTATTSFDLPRVDEIHLDIVVLAFTAAVSIAVGLLFGILPALQIVRPGLIDMLRHSGGTSGQGTAGRSGVLGVNTWGLLIIAQVALSMVLLVGAGLLIKSLALLASVDAGFQPTGLLTMRVPLPTTRYDTAVKRAAFFDEVVQRVNTVPGVRGATVVRTLPTTLGALGTNLQIQGHEIPEPGHLGISLQSITPGYFGVLGVPLRRGREFTDRDDTADAPPVVIINESFARRFWAAYPGGEDPLGKHIRVPILDAGPLEIVGIAADVRERGLRRDAVPQFYVPNILYPPNTGYLAIRTQQDPLSTVNAIRAEVHAVDPDQAVADIRTMDTIFAESVGEQHLVTWLLGLFAGTALLLAMIGLYGVLAYSVAQRTQEIGIRRALGAQTSDIMRNVLGHALTLVLVGMTLGIAGAVGLSKVMASLLFRTSPTDPMTFVGIALLFLIVALAASSIPARRAATVDPMRALR